MNRRNMNDTYIRNLSSLISDSLQWAVFEPNEETTWSKVRTSARLLLFNEFRSGKLMGTKQEEAFFIRCDRSIMTQDDIDNGRMKILVGIAVDKPSEFSTFLIELKTAKNS